MYNIFYLQIVLEENVHLYLLLRSNLTNQFPPKRLSNEFVVSFKIVKRLSNEFVVSFNKLALVPQHIPLGLLRQQMLYVVVFY